MQVKPLLGDGTILLRRIPQRRRGRLVKMVVVQWGDRAERERGKVQQTRRQDLGGVTWREPGSLGAVVGKIGHQGIDHKAVLEVLAPSLVELEALLLLRGGLDGRDGEILGR